MGHTPDPITRTDVQVLKNMIAAAGEWQRKLSGPKWVGTVAAENNLLRDAERIIDRLAQSVPA